MRVYRICYKEEIDEILKTKSFKDIGSPGSRYIKEQIAKPSNNHYYDKNERYMHFFSKFIDIFYLCAKEELCICTYDIPNEILKENEGLGDYLDYIYLNNHHEVKEYAIKSSQMDFDYLETVYLIMKYIDVEDYFYDKSLDGFLNTIYEKKSKQLNLINRGVTHGNR